MAAHHSYGFHYYYFYVYRYLPAYMTVLLDPMELELQVVVSCHVGAGNLTGAFRIAASATLNH